MSCDFSEAIRLFGEYCNVYEQDLKSRNHRDRILEVRTILDSLQNLTPEILALFEKATVNPPTGLPSLPEIIEAIRQTPEGKKWLGDKPNVKVRQSARVWTGNPPDPTLREMKAKTREFYREAHLLQKRLAGLPQLKRDPLGVSQVRTYLIEHAGDKHNRLTFDSFGYRTDHGPVVKPLRPDNQTSHPDRGFVPNCEELIGSLATQLKRALILHKVRHSK